MQDFAGKVAVVTGAASGIGRAIAERCAREGMKVVLAGINEENLVKAEGELKAGGAMAISVRTDVSRRQDVEALARRTLDAFGAVHLLVNNAGVGAGASPWESTWADWEWTLGVNLWGVIHGVKVFTPIMLAQQTECHIVNTASIAGLVVGALAPYTVSKHAVVALSESLHSALSRRGARVGVSVLCPGYVKTRLLESERNRPLALRNEPAQDSEETRSRREQLRAAIDAGMPPEQVADCVFRGIREGKLHILTHPENKEQIESRMKAILSA